MNVQLLGDIRVVRAGEERRLTSRRQRALVAALALRPGQAVSVAQLIEALWGEDPPDGARATLQTYVSRVRNLLGDDAVVHSAGGYVLAAGATSDVDRVRQFSEDARGSLEHDPARAADLAQQALELWRGPALADLADDPWFQPATAGLDELRANLTDLYAEASISSGRPEAAVELLEAFTREQPLREPSHVLHVRALHAAGRSTDALRAASNYRRLLRDETGLDPGGEFLAAEQAALVGDQPAPPRPRTTTAGAGPTGAATLPRPNRLVGRDDALAALARARAEHRLVSVTGPGGVGKTRLVAEALAFGPESSPITVVELAPVSAGDVAVATAAALNLRAERHHIDAIVDRLHGEAAVIVLDNAEHVLDEARDLVRRVLDRCTAVRFVVTSRERLGQPDEYVLVLDPLTTSGDRPPAVDLFLDRLAQSNRIVRPTGATAAVRRICSRLDGLPLALELAAGRAAALGVDELAARLDTALDLVAIPGELRQRHTDIRSMVGWSYDLLDHAARRLLLALSVFEGEFSLDAAERVGGASLDQPVSLLVSRLIDTSLVATTGDPGRYRLLETIRQFARDRLALEPALERAAHEAHARWLVRELHEIESAAVGPREASTSQRLDLLRNELRTAFRRVRALVDVELATEMVWPLSTPLLYRPDAELVGIGNEIVRELTEERDTTGPTIAAAGARLAFLAGELDRVEPLAELALARPAATSTIVATRARHALGVLALYRGQHPEAQATFDAIVDTADVGIIDRLDALGGLGLACCYQGDVGRAQAIVHQHLAIADTLDSDAYRAFALYMQAELDLSTGKDDAATDQLRRASELAWDTGASFVGGIASTVLAAKLVRNGRDADARAHLLPHVERLRQTGTWTQLWTSLRLLAEMLARHGHGDVAALVLAAAGADSAAPRLAGDDADRAGVLLGELRRTLGPAAFGGVVEAATLIPRAEVLRRATDTLTNLDLD